MTQPQNQDKKTNEPAPDPKAAETQKQLDQLKSTVDQQSKVLSHPTIQAVIKKLAAGEVVDLEGKASDEEKARLEAEKRLVDKFKKAKPADEVNFDELTNVQLVDNIAETVDGYLGEQKEVLLKEFDSKLTPLLKRLDETQNVIINLVAERNVQKAVGMFPDFDSYREDIGKIVQKYPSLSIEDAYKLAKGDKVSKLPAGSTNTEKPESLDRVPEWVPNRAKVPANNDTERRNDELPTGSRGPKGFRARLSEVLDKQLRK